jgi:DNA-binding GntR family transcriptional regulator
MTAPIQQLLVHLDRSGPIPLYYQIAKRLREAIGSGELSAGTRVENEQALVQQLGISRPTIRRALQELVDEGLLVRQRGIGTQVVGGPPPREINISSLSDDLQLGEHNLSTRVLLHEQIVPAQEVLDKLGLAAKTIVPHSRRLRFSNGVPFAVFEDFLHPDFLSITHEQLEEHDLYKIMRSRGTIPKVTRQSVSARAATREETKLFGMAKPRLPVLTVVRTVFDQSGRTVDVGWNAYHPDIYALNMTLVEK